jgi:DNA-binding transcriptional LysR family regulator
MDIQRLRIFAAVARAGSLSRAGQSLHLSQPAISLQIKQLQAELNMVLFERESQGMRLTRPRCTARFADSCALAPS